MAHPDVGGDLEAGQLPVDLAASGLGVAVPALPGPLDHGQLVGAAGVGDAGGGHFVDVGVIVEHSLDLGRGDVLPATDDDVLGPVHQEDVVFLIDVADVSGGHPAVAEGGSVVLRPLPVLPDGGGSLEPDLSHFAPGEFAARFVHRAEFDDGAEHAGAVGLALPEVAGAAGADGVGLGHAVASAGIGVSESSGDQLCQAGRGGGARSAYGEQAAGVVAVEVGVVQHVQDHGRGPGQGAQALPLDQLQGLGGIPAVHHDQLAPRPQRQQGQGVQSADVEQGHGQQNGRLEATAGHELDGFHVEHGGAGGSQLEGQQGLTDLALGAQGALGSPGGARGVHDHGRVFGGNGHFGQAYFSDARQKVVQGFRLGRQGLAVGASHQGLNPQASQVVGHILQALGIAEQDAGPGVLDAKHQLVAPAPAVEGDGDGAQADDGDKGGQPLGVVAHGDGDAVSFAHAMAVD